MEKSIDYKWKTLNLNKQYILQNDLESFSFQTENLKSSFFLTFLDTIEHKNEYNLFKSFKNNYSTIQIPLSTKELIDKILFENNIKNLNIEFYLLACVFQDKYVFSLEDLNELSQPLVKDFQNESKDLKILLDIINDTLKNGVKSINSISFKSKKTKTISNFFIVHDLLHLIIEGYGISLDNFEKRKTEILENTNNLKFDCRDEYWKYLFAKGLYLFISQDRNISVTTNKNIKFVGQFLHVTQIPVNKVNFEIPNSNNLKDILTPDDVKYLSLFIKRSKSFFIK